MRFMTMLAIALVAGLCCSQRVSAQSECPCNCYFSSDCPLSGQFCDWGSLSVEDSCWWREPKPEGNPGAGCTEDQYDWGWCDGICSPSGQSTALVGETSKAVRNGVQAWSDALLGTALDGGGTPSIRWLEHVGDVEFADPDSSYTIWRIMMETIALARGIDAFVFPRDDQPTPYTVAVTRLSADSAAYRNSALAVQAVLAEMEQEGSGRRFVDQMDQSALDDELFNRICDGAPDRMTCLYWRLGTFADVLNRSGRGGSGAAASRGGGPSCKGCYADCVPDDVVDVNDLLALLADWGSTDLPITDLDQNGIVNTFDLLDLLGGWGRCVPP